MKSKGVEDGMLQPVDTHEVIRGVALRYKERMEKAEAVLSEIMKRLHIDFDNGMYSAPAEPQPIEDYSLAALIERIVNLKPIPEERTAEMEQLMASLRAAAEKATPGKWSREWFYSIFRYLRKQCGWWDEYEMLAPDGVFAKDEDCDADYIAEASPANILKLLAAYASSQEALRSAREIIEEYRGFHMSSRRPCVESATCSTCQEAISLLSPEGSSR